MTGRLTHPLFKISCLACLASVTGCPNRSAQPAASVDERTRKLATLAAIYEQSNGDRFHNLIQSLAETFQVVDVTGEGDELSWQTVTLNKPSMRFDAVRFRSPLNVPADMRWVFSSPRRRFDRWYIAPVQGRMSGFTDYEYEDDIEIAGVELADDGGVFFQALDGGQIKPGEEYLLWFLFQHHDPVEFKLAIRLVEHGQLPESKTSEALARDLGIAIPFERNHAKALGELLDNAMRCYRGRDLLGALRFAEQARQLQQTDRLTLLYLASLHTERGTQLVEAKPTILGADPRAHFLIAAGHARLLQETYEELSEEEIAVLRKSLYFAAETHALSDRPEEALSTLRDALEAGYDVGDVDLGNFKSLQEMSEFLQLIKHQATTEANTVRE